MLERVSDLLRWQHYHPDFNLPWKEEVLLLLDPSRFDHYTTSLPESLSPREENNLKLSEKRLFQLCRACQAASLPMLVDVEYTVVKSKFRLITYKSLHLR